MPKFICNDIDEQGNDIPGTGCGEIDHIIFNGYSFGDRMLEGVMFKAWYEGDELRVTSVEEWDESPYLRQLNKDYWMGCALAHAKQLDVAQCPNCGNEVVGPLKYDGG